MTLMSVFTLTDFAIFFAGFVGVVAVFAALFALGEWIGRNIKSRTALCVYAVFAALIAYGGYVIYLASNNPYTAPQPVAWLCALVPIVNYYSPIEGPNLTSVAALICLWALRAEPPTRPLRTPGTELPENVMQPAS